MSVSDKRRVRERPRRGWPGPTPSTGEQIPWSVVFPRRLAGGQQATLRTSGSALIRVDGFQLLPGRLPDQIPCLGGVDARRFVGVDRQAVFLLQASRQRFGNRQQFLPACLSCLPHQADVVERVSDLVVSLDQRLIASRQLLTLDGIERG